MGDASIDLDGPPLCPECGRGMIYRTAVAPWLCTSCERSLEGRWLTARDQAPWHSAEIERLRAAYRSALDALHAVGQRGLDERGTLCSVLAQDVDPAEPGSAEILIDRARQTVREIERLRAEADRTKDAWDRDVAELHAASALVLQRELQAAQERVDYAKPYFEESNRLRARVAELEAICNEPDPLPTELLAAQMDGDMRVVAMMRERDAALAREAELETAYIADGLIREAFKARVAELEARPTVHPLAWGRLRTESAYWNEDSGEQGLYAMRSALEYWRDEDCPLTATGGEVLVPGEEP